MFCTMTELSVQVLNFSDADLIGIPIQIIVGKILEKTIKLILN